MLEQFKQKYLEEVNDLLNKMESVLLELEHNPDDRDGVNSIFRVMHTIKGTCGMYDFKEVEGLTHEIENVYGVLRDNSLSVSKNLINTTLDGVDIIRLMLNQPDGDFKSTVQQYIARLSQTSGVKPKNQDIKVEEKPEEQPLGAATYFVHFAPDADITSRGVNLSRIIEDLEHIPGVVIIPHSYPEGDYSNKFYMYWEAVFATDSPVSDIEDIFMFVADEVKITRISPTDLLKDSDFVKKLQTYQESGEDINIEQLTNSPSKTSKTEEAPPAPAATAIPQPLVSDENLTKEEKIIGKNIEALDSKTTSIKVDADKLDELMNLVSELVVTKAEILSIADKYNLPELDSLSEKIDKLSNKFKDNALSIRLVPIGSMMLRFERLIRDLSKELGKEIDFITEGTDTELDKTIIDNLAVPLMHIIRNSIDHGIEPVERRRQLKKPDHGVIKFTAFYSGANVFIQVQDDGAGMNPDLLRAKAIEKGFLQHGQEITNKQLYDLVFRPGFSTAQTITGISGRGVGMDVVKQNILKLRGEIEIDSEINLGTITTIKLPLTLLIIDSLLVSLDEILLLIPLYLVDSCIQININQINTENNHYAYNGDPLPVVNLRTILDTGGQQPDITDLVIIKYKDSRICFTVDKVVEIGRAHV